MAIWRDIDACRGKLVRALHDYWVAKRAGRGKMTSPHTHGNGFWLTGEVSLR